MYNLFLGLRAATQNYDPGTAVAVLNPTPADAANWNRPTKIRTLRPT